MLIIIENFLDSGGHYQTQIEAIKRLSNTKRLEIITSRNCAYQSTDSSISIIKILSSYPEIKNNYYSSIRKDTNCIVEYLEQLQSNVFAPVIIPSAESYDIRLVLSIILNNPALARFHIRILDERFVSELTEAELSDLRKQVLNGNIFLLTETGALSDRLLSRFGLLSQDSFLLPCVVFPDADSSVSTRENSGRPYRIGFLGGRRREKGYKQIPSILRAIRRKNRTSEGGVGLEFLIQENRTTGALKNMIYNINLRHCAGLSILSNKSKIRIIKYPAILPDEDFETIIRFVDVLILPYSLENYKYRGSGIITDGVLSRTPIVYTKGIAMSSYLGHGNAEAASSPEEFADKILKVLSNLTEYRANGVAAREALLQDLEKTTAYLAELSDRADPH